jgi:hypothetical protein
VVTHSIQTIPVLAELKYDFSPGMTVRPYAAVGIGGNIIQYNQLFGEFGSQQNKFRFAAHPELGLHIPLKQDGAGFTVGASYNIMPLKQDGLENLNSIGVHAGIRIPLRK